MNASALLRIEAPCRMVELRAESPFAVRSDGTGTMWLVGSAAGPLGGDDLSLRIDVGPGARARIRSVAAQLVLPGPGRTPARVRIEASVADGGHLDWGPEPTVVAAGADLRHTSVVDMAAGATLRWREVVVLGRHDEEPGRVAARLRVDLGGRPLLRHELHAGGDDNRSWDGPAGLAGARAVAAELLAGGGAGDAPLVRGSCRGDAPVVLPLDGDGVLAVVAAADARTAIASLRLRHAASMV